MSHDIKIRAKYINNSIIVKALMVHPMETGFRKDKKTNEVISAHYIKEVNAYINNEHIYQAYLGSGVAKNPFISFIINGGKSGDTVNMTWIDSKNLKGMGQAVVK